MRTVLAPFGDVESVDMSTVAPGSAVVSFVKAEDAMKEQGGGRVLRSAYQRLFGSMKHKMSFLLTQWACNDWGEPEEE